MNGIRNQNSGCTYNLRIPHKNCGFRLLFRIQQQLNLTTTHMSHYLFVDSTNCSGFRKYGCGFRNFAYFWSNFELDNLLGICLWNPKQQRRSKKGSNNAVSATNLTLTCCGIPLQCTECTFWPRKEAQINSSGPDKTAKNKYFSYINTLIEN